MRLVDVIFRGGHLSEQALIEAVMTAERPAHLDRCDICAERAVELGRWLDQVRTTGNEAVDEAFPAERLAAQQQQILRRLEQLDQPSRVISFPSQTRTAPEMGGRRVAPGWLAVAAAAGVVLGVLGGQVANRMNPAPQPPTATGIAQAPQHEAPPTPALTLLDESLDRRSTADDPLDAMTPTIVMARGGN